MGEGQCTLFSQTDEAGIESGIALRSGKAYDERSKQESEGQHVDLVALFFAFLTTQSDLDWIFDENGELTSV